MSRNFFPVVMAIGVGVFTGSPSSLPHPPLIVLQPDSDVKFLRRLLHLPANFPTDGGREGPKSSAITAYRVILEGDQCAFQRRYRWLKARCSRQQVMLQAADLSSQAAYKI